MPVMKQLEVQIMGQSYLLACPEGGEQRLLEAVEKVDTAMCKIRDAGKVKARDRIAVLAALNLAFDVADRNVAPLQAASFAAPEANGNGNGNGKVHANGNGQDANDPRLGLLLQRLDSALGDDGRLL
jgi:cell division protein ZapA